MSTLNSARNNAADGDGLPKPNSYVLDGTLRILGHTNTPSRYQDSRWDISHGHLGRHVAGTYLDFAQLPKRYQEHTKLLMYNVLNRIPPILPKNSNVSIVSVGTAKHAFACLVSLTNWMSENNLDGYAELNRINILKYMRGLSGNGIAASFMMSYTRVWCHNFEHPHGLELPKPPWFELGIDKFIGNGAFRLENSTPPIPTEVITPLFRSALTVCEWVVSGDVSADLRKAGEHTKSDINLDKVLAGYASEFTAKNINIRLNPFPAEVRAAAAIVLSYLTGMRPDEVLSLKRDSLEVIQLSTDDGNVQRRYYLLHGHTFKNMRHRDSSLITEGVVRDSPWVTLQPAETAIAALKIVSKDPEYLFAPVRAKNSASGFNDRGISTAAVNAGVPKLINYWNSLARFSRREAIPVIEPSGITYGEARLGNTPRLKALRRTLAWHIVNQPNGEIALAIQYGHVQLASSLGYAGRATSGFPQEIELSFALHAWDTLTDLSISLDRGESASGPAANRLLSSVQSFDHSFNGAIRNERQLNRFRESGLAKVYDNPSAMLVCVYDERVALCRRSNLHAFDDLPRLSECQPRCANIARTDAHIAEGLAPSSRAEELESMPPLVKRRIESARSSARHRAAKHSAVSKVKDWSSGE